MDSRAKQYIKHHGRQSWELDALDPRTISDLIEYQIRELLDFEKWNAALARQAQSRELLASTARRWDAVVKMLEDDPGRR